MKRELFAFQGRKSALAARGTSGHSADACGMALLQLWQSFRRSHISPDRMTVISKAVLILERQR